MQGRASTRSGTPPVDPGATPRLVEARGGTTPPPRHREVGSGSTARPVQGRGSSPRRRSTPPQDPLDLPRNVSSSTLPVQRLRTAVEHRRRSRRRQCARLPAASNRRDIPPSGPSSPHSPRLMLCVIFPGIRQSPTGGGCPPLGASQRRQRDACPPRHQPASGHSRRHRPSLGSREGRATRTARLRAVLLDAPPRIPGLQLDRASICRPARRTSTLRSVVAIRCVPEVRQPNTESPARGINRAHLWEGGGGTSGTRGTKKSSTRGACNRRSW